MILLTLEMAYIQTRVRAIEGIISANIWKSKHETSQKHNLEHCQKNQSKNVQEPKECTKQALQEI